MTAPKKTPRVSMKELSTIGLKAGGGYVLEEIHEDLAWPQSKVTFKKMSYDSSIASATNTIKAFVKKAQYNVVTNGEQTSEAKQKQIDFVKSLMRDMDESFNDVMSEALSILEYGYSIHEKVFKRRNQKGKHKSLYNDERIGWAKLPIRSQDSIDKFHFDGKGRELTFVEQNLNLVSNQYDPEQGGLDFKDNVIKIPRGRFLHFRHNKSRNNPEGNSPMKACYIPWMYKSKIEELQAIGIARDYGGLPYITLPIDYMSEDAEDYKKDIYAYCKNIIQNLQANEQAGIIFPSYVDPETNQPAFTFDLKSVDGGKLYDTDKIISSYENKILMTFLADVLKMGQDATGSFALSDNKTNLLAVGIHAIINEILQEFNDDLIPQTLAINGFDISDGDLPRIIVEELDEVDLEVVAKAAQQLAASGLIEVDKKGSDKFRGMLGLEPADDSKPITDKMRAGGESKSGEGMKTGSDNGTAKKPSAKNQTTANASHK